jgi:hypothetical protein
VGRQQGDAAVKLAGSLGLTLSAEQLQALDRFWALLLTWNARINLTGARSEAELIGDHLPAGITYNQFIEGVAALAGYKGWSKFFQQVDGRFPGLQEGLRLIQRDERRHIAYGTYLCRRIIAAHPETWDFVEKRWAELTKPYVEARRNNGGGGRYIQALIDRRYQVLEAARHLTVEQVEGVDVEELEATSELAGSSA